MKTIMFRCSSVLVKSSIKYALAGIGEGWRNHPNFRRQIGILVVVLAAGWWYKISGQQWLAVILASGLVLSAEMANTAIESAVNLATREKRLEAKVAKDAAAGGVLMSAAAAAIVGLLIFLPRVYETFFDLIFNFQ